MLLLANFINRNSNKILLLLLFLFFVVGLLSYKDYGISVDEKFHRYSGFFWLNYVLSFLPFENLSGQVLDKFNNIGDFTLPQPENYPGYGIVFDLPAALFEVIFKINDSQNYFYFRHLLIFLIFFTGSVFFYKLLNNRFSNFNVSIIGFIFYIASPRIYGHSFFNNVDLTFLPLVTIALYFCFKNFDKLTYNNLILFSLFAALATSIRIVGIFLPISFILIYFSSVLAKRNEIKHIWKIIFFLLVYFIFLVAFWPYLWESPIKNFIQTFEFFSKFPLNIKMFFNGSYVSSNFLPYSYIPIWIGLTTPLLYLFFFVLGFFYLLKRFFLRFLNIKERSKYNDLWRGNNEKKDLYIFFNFFAITLYLIFADKVLYTGWRQIYFLNIFIIYISTFMIYVFLINLKSFKKKVFFNWGIFIILFSIILDMVNYHPYQNIYFNKLVSDNYKKKFEIDYWGLSGVKFLKNILELEKNEKLINVGVASWLPLERSLDLIDIEERTRINIVGQNYNDAKYILDTNISEVDKNINNKYNIPETFIKIDEFIINGTSVFKVYKKNIN